MVNGTEHARAQAEARYGLRLDDRDFGAMVVDIVLTVAGTATKACLLQRQYSHREIWIVRVPDGPAVIVVYEPACAKIITVLPCKWRKS